METLGQFFAKSSYYKDLMDLLLEFSIERDFINYGLINEKFDNYVKNNITHKCLEIIKNSKKINIDDYTIEEIIILINVNPRFFMKNDNEFYDSVIQKLSTIRNDKRYGLFFSILEKLNINIEYIEVKEEKHYKEVCNFENLECEPIYILLNWKDSFNEIFQFIKDLEKQTILDIANFISDKSFDKFDYSINILNLQIKEIYNYKTCYYGLISKEYDKLIQRPKILDNIKNVDIYEVTDEEFILCFSNYWHLKLKEYYAKNTDERTYEDKLCELLIERASNINKKYTLFHKVFDNLEKLPLSEFKSKHLEPQTIISTKLKFPNIPNLQQHQLHSIMASYPQLKS